MSYIKINQNELSGKVNRVMHYIQNLEKSMDDLNSKVETFSGKWEGVDDIYFTAKWYCMYQPGSNYIKYLETLKKYYLALRATSIMYSEAQSNAIRRSNGH